MRRHLVAVPLDGSQVVRELVGGSDFLAHPRVSPDGAHLAWLAWDHPQMPWDGTELRVAPISSGGTIGRRAPPRRRRRGRAPPEWADASTLYAVTDRSGWWNSSCACRSPGDPEPPLHPAEEEFGAPLWQLGQTTYALLDDGRLAVTHGVGRAALGVLDPRDGTLVDVDLPFGTFASSVRAPGRPRECRNVARPRPQRSSSSTSRAARWTSSTITSSCPTRSGCSVPTDEALPGPDGRVVHALVHLADSTPLTPSARGELPPYVVLSTAARRRSRSLLLSVEKAFFTSRGIGVLDELRRLDRVRARSLGCKHAARAVGVVDV